MLKTRVKQTEIKKRSYENLSKLYNFNQDTKYPLKDQFELPNIISWKSEANINSSSYTHTYTHTHIHKIILHTLYAIYKRLMAYRLMILPKLSCHFKKTNKTRKKKQKREKRVADLINNFSEKSINR